MKTRSITVKLLLAHQELVTAQVSDGKLLHIRITPHGRIELMDSVTGKAPPSIVVKRIGKDLHVQVPGDERNETEILFQDFYASEHHLIGVNETGHHVTYETMTAHDASIAQLSEGMTSQQVLDVNDLTHSASLLPFDGGLLFGSWAIVTAAEAKKEGAASPSTPPVVIDTTAPAPPTIDAVATDDILNFAEQTTVITGTNEAGASVALNIGGITRAATVTGGTWRYTLTAADITGLGQGSVLLSATQTDASGNTSAAGTRPFRVDTIAPTLTLDAIANDNQVNAVEKSAGITLSGTAAGAESGQLVTVDWAGTFKTFTLTGTGVWSVHFSSAEVPADGTRAVSVTVSDASGNPALAVTRDIVISTGTPTITLHALTDGAGTPGDADAMLNAHELSAIATANTWNLSGATTLIENGQNVILTLNGEVYTGTVTSNSWHVDLPASDVLALANGNTYALTVNVQDAVQNSATASQQLQVVTSPPDIPTVMVLNASSMTPTLTGSAQKETYLGAGVFVALDVGDQFNVSLNGQTYTYTLGGSNNPSALSYNSATKNWRLVVAALVLTADGAYDVGVSVNAVGYSTPKIDTSSNELVIKTTAPVVTVNPISTDDYLNALEHMGSITLTGTVTDNNPATTANTAIGQHVTVSLNGNTYTGMVQLHGVWSVTIPAADVTALADGAHTVTASYSGIYSIAGSNTRAVIVDTTVPVAPVINAATPDDIINGTEQAAVISGTNEAGATVALILGGNTRAATVTGVTWRYTLTAADITAMGQGAETLSVTQTDAAGNTSIAATRAITIDTVAPTAPTFALTTDTGTLGDNISSNGSVTVAGVETGGTWEYSTDGGTTWTAGSGSTFTLDAAAYAPSAVQVRSYDAGSNVSTVARNASAIVIDSTSPTLAMTSDKTVLIAGETATITFIFSEATSDFTWDGSTGDIVVSGGTLSAISGSGITYTAIFTPTPGLASGTASISVAAGNYTDGAGNTGGAGTTPTITIDTLPPTLTLAGDGGTGVITFNFSETPVNFTLADIVLSNGTAGALTMVNATQYTLAVTPAFTETSNNIAVDVSAGAFTDAAGNTNALAENATSISGKFQNSSFSTNITGLDVSNVTNAGNAFLGNTTFNQTIGGWNTSRITLMNSMFLNSLFNQDIGAWDTGQVTSMLNMFGGTPFNQDIGLWNTHNVTSMSGMFNTALYFNQNIGNWDTSHVTSMSSMFSNASAFNQNIGNWNTASVTSMALMFQSATAFNQNITQWNTGLVTNMSTMFSGATAFNQNIGTWDTDHVTNMNSMFRNATAFNQDIGQWNVSALTTATNFLTGSGMSTANIDKLLAGWSDVDTSTGETALRTGVSLGLGTKTYTDATSRQYLISTSSWTIDGTLLAGVIVGGNAVNDTLNQSAATSGKIMHGLGGTDVMTGSAFADTLVGGAGNDTLTGGSGMDIFRYNFTNEGNDTLTDFAMGAGGDALDISHLLDGATDATLANFVKLVDAGSNVLKLNIDANGNASGTDVSVTLNGISYSAAHALGDANYLQQMLLNGNLLTHVL